METLERSDPGLMAPPTGIAPSTAQVKIYYLVERLPRDERHHFPHVRHETFENAMVEAERLAYMEHVPFVILEAIKVIVPKIHLEHYLPVL